MDAFIGVRVQVTFKDPSAQTVHGTITAVQAGVNVTLKDVDIVNRPGTRLPALIVPLHQAKDVTTLKAIPSSIPPAPKPANIPQPASISAPISPTKVVPLTGGPDLSRTNTFSDGSEKPPIKKGLLFSDIAIISVGRPSSVSHSGHASDAARSGGESKGFTTIANQSIPAPVMPVQIPPTFPVSGTSTLADPEVADVAVLEIGIAELGVSSHKPKGRNRNPNRETRVTRNRKQRDSLRQTMVGSNGVGKGKGWRNTPLLEDVESFQPFKALKRYSKKGYSGRDSETWGQEDYSEMEEFDFEGSLARFDKRSVFEEINKCDTIPEDARLVYHNIKAKPSTAGGKNLHHTEMVLDKPSTLRPKPNDDYWNSEADVHIEERRSSKPRKPEGRPALVRQGSLRKPSITGNLTQTGSRGNSQVRRAGHTGSFIGDKQLTVTATQLGRRISGFYVVPSNRYLDPISPLQMVTLENTAVNELGLPEIVMIENAARGVASITLNLLTDPAVRHGLGVGNSDIPLTELIKRSVILILAGNNKSGVRAIATARQLRAKGVEVILCVVDIDRESVLVDAVKNQVRLYRNYGGKVYDKSELFDHYRSAKELGTPIVNTLIIDGLLGLTVPFDELRTAEQTTVYELIHWVDKDPGFIISLDVPSGVDPVTGKISIVDGMPLHIKSRYIIAMAAPKRGLAEAIGAANNEEEDTAVISDATDWRLWIVDIGFDNAVWKKAGVKARHPVDFGGEWVCRIEYRGLGGESEEE